MKKIYELEYDFINKFNYAITKIQFGAEDGEPYTLRRVLEDFGFNYVCLITEHISESGYEITDFSEEALNTKVDFDYWDTDEDGFRIVCLKECE